MKEYQYKLLLHKRYFDIGFGFTAILKYLIAFFGIAGTIVTQDMTLAMWLGTGYFFFCYIFGFVYVKYGWYEADIEVGNRFNLFVKEMRRNYK